MHGLKLNISLTLALLLATGMLLTDVIVATLWQRSLLTTLADSKKNELLAIAEIGGRARKSQIDYLHFVSENTPGLCGGILAEGKWQAIPAEGCPEAGLLRGAIDRAAAEGVAITSSTGNILSALWARKDALYIAVPLPEDPAGAMGMAYPLPPTWETLRQHQKIILMYILFNVIVLTAIGFFRIAAIAIRPIDRLIDKTSNYTGEEELGLVFENEGSEFRHLSSAINRMVQRIDTDKINLQQTVLSLKQANATIQKTQQEMVRAEKLASVGRLSAGLAHEIGNPLGIVLGYLGLLRQDAITRENRLEYIQRSEQELNRINSLVRQLLDFARPLPAASEPVHVHPLLLDLQRMLATRTSNRAISITTDLQADHDVVHGNADSLRQAFLNFLLNAQDAIQEADKEPGAIGIASSITEDGSGSPLLQITITDNGAGIAPDQLKNIFDPFFTTKPPGKGTGLGLSVSLAIIENTGGRIRATSTEGQGTSLIIELPTAPELRAC